MLKLKNIKFNNGILTAEYDPENSGKVGTVSIDANKMEVIESKQSELDETFPIYLHHAIEGLKKLTQLEKMPNEKLIMWH